MAAAISPGCLYIYFFLNASTCHKFPKELKTGTSLALQTCFGFHVTCAIIAKQIHTNNVGNLEVSIYLHVEACS